MSQLCKNILELKTDDKNINGKHVGRQGLHLQQATYEPKATKIGPDYPLVCKSTNSLTY